VRQSDPAKQCIWLGPDRYFSRCRDAATSDPDSDAQPVTFGDSMRAGNTNANADSDSHTNRNGYGDANCNNHAECNSYRDAHGNGDYHAVTHSCPKGNTQAAADPASAPVRAVILIGDR
jgi:hypothetical protein